MLTSSTSSAASVMRRKILGWGGATSIAALVTYLGWNRGTVKPGTPAQAAPHPALPSDARHSTAQTEAAQEPVEDTTFTREAFLPHLNTDFTIIPEGMNASECRLIEVSAERRISSPKTTYISFTLLFSASPTFLPAGGTCRIKHKKMDEMMLFLSHVGKPGTKTMLEAAFTQAI